MKSETQVVNRLSELTEQYKNSNAFGQAFLSQAIIEICWVLDINFTEYHLKNLKPYDKARGKQR